MQIGAIQGSSAAQLLQTPTTTTTKASALAYYDPADTNQDGVVSAAERLAYDLNHPNLTTLATATTQPVATGYTQRGTLPTQTSNLFDFKA